MFQRSRLGLVLAIVIVIGIVAASLRAQGRQDCPDCLKVIAAGGLLGFLDGFPEYVGRYGEEHPPPVDATSNDDPKDPIPYGGLIGLSKMRKKHAPDSLLLLTGNNHPQRLQQRRRTTPGPGTPDALADWFWTQVLELRPQAIGIGTEDVHRLLAQMHAQELVAWLQNGIRGRNCPGAKCRQLPFVATNAVIRLSGDALNVIEDEGTEIRLEIPETESLGWVKSLKLAHPCSQKRLALKDFRFEEPYAPDIDIPADGGQAVLPGPDEDTGEVCHTTIELSGRLRPGRTYTLAAPGTTSPGFAFRFRTHQVLTPHEGPGPWNGLPVVRVARDSMSLAIMAFMTAEVAGELPPSFAAWEGRPCAAQKCRLDYLAPAEAARAVLDLGSEPNVPLPLLLAMTDLFEEETDTLLDQVPELRFVALQPEALRLGRAAMPLEADKSKDARNYSGDLSFTSVVDREEKEVARILARPEWIGQVISHAQMRVGRPAMAHLPWTLEDIATKSTAVRGADLEFPVGGQVLRYQAKYPESLPVDADPLEYPAYCPLDAKGRFDSSRQPQGGLWTKRTEMIGLLLDEMRGTARADAAIVPASWVDADVIRWLKWKSDTSADKRLNGLSGFILQRALFRVERIVTVAVDAATVPGLLQKIVAGAAEWGDPVCASGLGEAAGCPFAKLDTTDLWLNRRRAQPGHYYKLAMPASLAREHALTFDDEKTIDILEPLDERLAGCASGPALSDQKSLHDRLELARSARFQHYAKIDPVAFEYSVTEVHEPAGAEGLFAKLPLDNSSAKDNKLILVEVDADIAPLDTRRWAVRIPVMARFTRKDLEDSRSYDKDDYVVGLRGDYKRLVKGIARVFGGLFLEGDFAVRREQVRAVRTLSEVADPERPGEILTNLSVPGPQLTFVTERPLYVFLSGGGELSKLDRTWGAISDIRVSADYGRASNIPRAVLIGGVERDLEEFIRGGAAGVLKAVYQDKLDTITTGTPFGFAYTRRPRLRFQLDGKIEFKTGGRTKLSIANRARYYNQIGDEPLLVTRWSWRGTFSWDVPIGKRWSLAPYYERNLVKAKGVDGRFRVSQGGIKIKWATFWKSGHGVLFE